MNKGRVAIIWLLILIPALSIGIGSLVLLRHEKERLEQASIRALQDRAQIVVDDINLAVTSLQEGLIENIKDTPHQELQETLAQLERENPLIRNVFICRENGELLLPQPSERASEEKAHFISRYDALFSGRVAWIERKEETIQPFDQHLSYVQVTNNDIPQQTEQYQQVAAIQQAAPQQQQRAQPTLQQQTAPNSSLRNSTISQISKLSKINPVKGGHSDYPAAETPSNTEEGWMPWYWENEFHLLGYIHELDRDMCYGVEIEMIALLSRLTTSLEAVRTPQTIISLEDKHGKIINYIGDGEISEGVVPTLTIPVGPNLPHYQVSVYSAGFGYGGSLGSSFLLVSSLLVGIFVLSIITGGILLNAHAQKSQRDAIQKTSFVSNVSHELKTPLTTIRMYTELLHEERITDASKRKNYLQVILNESERLSRLVNNVLDFGRLEQGRKKYELNSIDLSALINEVMEGQCLRLDKAGFETHIELPDTPLMVHSDRDALEQILLNITDNALKYARDGKELTVALAKEGSNVLVQIMDRGPGVPKAHQKHIFTKFHRVDDSLTAEQGGSGLGLTIAYRLLHGLGGQLSVHDREGGGAIFSLVIPTAQKSESHEQYADH